MTTLSLANQIKDQRISRGLSQEQLADNSQLSLRTIQRIEKGQSTPRGDTLLKLIEALDLCQDEVLKSEKLDGDKYSALLNLTALGFLAHPLLGFPLSLIVWQFVGKRSVMLTDTAKKVFITQVVLISCLYLCLYIFAAGRHILFDFNIIDFQLSAFRQMSPIITYAIGFLYIICISLIFFNFIKNLQGKKSKYLFVV